MKYKKNETTKAIEKISKPNDFLVEKIHILIRNSRQSHQEKKKSQIITIRNKKGSITTEPTDAKRNIR